MAACAVLLGSFIHLHAFEITSPEIIPIAATVDVPFQGNPLTTSTKVGNDQWRFASTFIPPAGWTINSKTGVIKGTPTAAMVGTFLIRVAADNYNYSPTYASKVLKLTVNKNTSLAFFSVASFPAAVYDIDYHGPTLSANRTDVTYAVLSPPTPSNWTIDPTTGSISGQPSLNQVGTTLTMTVLAQKPGYDWKLKTFSLSVNANPNLRITTDPVTPGAYPSFSVASINLTSNVPNASFSIIAPSGYFFDRPSNRDFASLVNNVLSVYIRRNDSNIVTVPIRANSPGYLPSPIQYISVYADPVSKPYRFAFNPFHYSSQGSNSNIFDNPVRVHIGSTIDMSVKNANTGATVPGFTYSVDTNIASIDNNGQLLITNAFDYTDSISVTVTASQNGQSILCFVANLIILSTANN